ncbi:hypothetical protein ABW19_dt0206279 [Dactylella cylindrospora]|nr:hypothetical protein ABW19_dt0206279 [Dactylella cylindrospora]
MGAKMEAGYTAVATWSDCVDSRPASFFLLLLLSTHRFSMKKKLEQKGCTVRLYCGSLSLALDGSSTAKRAVNKSVTPTPPVSNSSITEGWGFPSRSRNRRLRRPSARFNQDKADKSTRVTELQICLVGWLAGGLQLAGASHTSLLESFFSRVVASSSSSATHRPARPTLPCSTPEHPPSRYTEF